MSTLYSLHVTTWWGGRELVLLHLPSDRLYLRHGAQTKHVISLTIQGFTIQGAALYSM